MTSSRADVALRLASEGMARLCGFITLPLLARSLGSDGYGVVSGSGAIVGGFAALATLGLSYHVGRIVGRGETPAARRLLRRLLLLAGGSGLFWALAVIATSPWLNRCFLGHPSGGAAIACASGSLVAMALDGVLLEWLRQRERFRALSMLQGGMALLQLAALATAVSAGAGPAMIMAVTSAMQLLRLGAMGLIIRHSPRAPDLAHPPLDLSLEACLRDGLSLTLGSLGAWGLGQGGRLVLGDAGAIGGYAVAAALASLAGMIGSAAGMPLASALVRAIAGKRPRAEAVAVRRFASIYHLITIPGIAIAASLAGDAIVCLTGFHGLGGIATILMIAGWLEMAALPLVYALWAHGWASRSRNALLAAATGALLGAAILAKCIGPVGVALAALCGQAALILLAAWGLRHARFPWAALLPRHPAEIASSALLGGAAAVLLSGTTWLELLTAGMAAAVAAALPLAIGRVVRSIPASRRARWIRPS